MFIEFVEFVGFVEFIELEKHLLDDYGDDEPSDDAHGTAEHVVVIFRVY